MAVGFASYEIARSGLTVNERGLYVTGHNIANVNTPGYVRQQAIIETSPYKREFAKYGIFEYGLGADIQQVRQIRHIFLDNIYRQENTTFGYWESRSKTLQDVQAILGEPMGAGLQNVMNQFWDSWQELSKAPDSLTVRALVRQRGEALVYHVNHMGQQLDMLQSNLNKEISARVDEVNRITGQIAKLNVKIMENEVAKDSANDLRDQRNLLLDNLTKIVNADIIEMQDGQLAVTVGGYYLVNRGTSTKVVVGESKSGGMFYIPKLEGTDIELPVKSGTLKGLLESRGQVYGATGSIQNGSPSSKADIVFAVDVSNGTDTYLANIKANITKYIDELKIKGIDYNLRLITYGDGIKASKSYGDDYAALISDIPNTAEADTGNNFGGAGGVLEEIEKISDFRDYSSRQVIVFTGESIDGDGGTPVTDASGYIKRLSALGIRTSVVTEKSSFNSGDPAGEAGWEAITDATGGSLFDISSADYTQLMKQLSQDTKKGTYENVSTITDTNNIISDLRRKLNALINVMVREVNNIHRSGQTLDKNPGGDFFTVIDSKYPMEMGNLKLSDGLMNLNNLVASAGGASGDNTIALKIANMRHDLLMGKAGEEISLDDFYRSIILDIGNIGNDADRISENQRQLVKSADSQRQSIAGVSMDEEMTNMMKYKFAYDASSRALNLIDEMMETIINKMGLAGR